LLPKLQQFLFLLKLARTHSFLFVLARVLARLGLKSKLISVIEFFSAPEFNRPTKSAEILLKSFDTLSFSPKDFFSQLEGADCLEIGCGKYAGLAPFFISFGAKNFVGIDPSVDSKLIKNNLIHSRFFEPSLKAHGKLAQDLRVKYDLGSGNHENSANAFKQNTFFFSDTVEKFPENRVNFKFCCSISCLEHIIDLETAVSKLASHTSFNCIHFHIVNFSNHLSKSEPFIQLYEMPYADFGRKWNYNVNGLRVPDILSIFQKSGIPVAYYPLDIRKDLLPSHIHSDWIDKYDTDVLAVRTALFVSECLNLENSSL